MKLLAAFALGTILAWVAVVLAVTDWLEIDWRGL
jgi:hypothetical protein